MSESPDVAARDLDAVAEELTDYEIAIEQADGPARTVRLNALGPALGGTELTVSTDGDERALTPEKAWWLADVTEAMLQAEALRREGAAEFVARLREWAAAAGGDPA